ncbi:MAG: SH3 domain-containing protein [Bacteroidales bacterium]|nr:SH3 domain-containing protein [Bacteroidales bacterium]
MERLIRLLVLCVFMISSAYRLSGQASNEERFSEGVDLYTSSSYQEALDVWTDIYNTGYRSADLAFNIGNAYFKLNNIPGAILFYERALLLRPGDEDTGYNLAIARSMTKDKFEEIPELFFVRGYDFISLILPSNTWAIMSLTTFILCLILLSVYIYSSRYRIKVTGFWLALFFLVFSLSSLAFSLRNRSLVHDSSRAIIFSPQVSGKSSPDNSGTDLFVIHEGTKVTVTGELGEWYEIRLSDGNKGWVPSGSLDII